MSDAESYSIQKHFASVKGSFLSVKCFSVTTRISICTYNGGDTT